MSTCKRKGCEGPGTAYPVLMVPLAGTDAKELAVGVGLPTLPHCSEHQATTTTAELVAFFGWDRLNQTLESRILDGLDWEGIRANLGDGVTLDAQQMRAVAPSIGAKVEFDRDRVTVHWEPIV